jgi:hypothetical protein
VLVEALLRQGGEAAAEVGGSQSAGAFGVAVKGGVGSDEKVGGPLGGRYPLAERIGEGDPVQREPWIRRPGFSSRLPHSPMRWSVGSNRAGRRTIESVS